MKAIAIDDFGAPPTLRDMPVPEPGEGDVLVRVRASSVNGFDVAVANGSLKGMMEHRFPVVLGKDFAGTIEAAGPGVQHVEVGETVFGVVMGAVLGDGAFAEHVTAGAAFVARIPTGLTVATAGALGLAGAAALDAVDALEVTAGETVLVSGATGAVGALAVQLAAARGAHVIATAQPGDEEAFVRGLGAHDVVDYTSDDTTSSVLALRPDGVDAVVHAAGDGVQLADVLVAGGRIASTIGLTPDELAGRGFTISSIVAMPTTATLERLGADVVAGTLTLPIQRTYPLADVPQALVDFAAGKLGKLAVEVG